MLLRALVLLALAFPGVSLGATGQAAGKVVNPGLAGNSSSTVVTATGSTAARPLKDRFADVVNVRDFGAKGDGSTDDTAAIQAAVNAAPGGTILVPHGTFITNGVKLSTGQRLIGFGRYGTNPIYPQGTGASILKARDASTVAVVEVDGGGSYVRDIEIGWLLIQGSGASGAAPAGIAHGIYIHNAYDAYGGPSHIYIHDNQISRVGGKGIYVPQQWHCVYERNSVDYAGDNAFEIGGGLGTILSHNYAETVADGKVGYRIYAGATMISNNGINVPGVMVTGASWGVFGSRVADGDAADLTGRAIFIGNNVEAFSSIGIRLKTGITASFLGNTFIADRTNAVKALLFDYAGDGLILDATNAFKLSGAGNWANGYAVHVRNGIVPLAIGSIEGVWGSENAGNQAYDDQNSIALGLPTIDLRSARIRMTSFNVASGGYQNSINYVTTSWGMKSARTYTWDPPSVASGAVTSVDIGEPDVAVGDDVMVSFSIGIPLGCQLTAQTISTGHVGVTLRNDTGSPVDLASGTLRITVIKHL